MTTHRLPNRGEEQHVPWHGEMEPLLIKENNLDILRLTFAMMVCIFHVAVLSGEPALQWVQKAVSGSLGVKAFFIVSGLLIFRSYEQSISLGQFWRKRWFRIYPAYFVVVLSAAICLAALSRLSAGAYFGSAEFWRYLSANLVFGNFLAPDLPAVFIGHRITDVNGSLWTLKIEVMFYLAVPLIVWLCRRCGYMRTFAILYVASTIYWMACQQLSAATGIGLYAEFGRQLPGQLRYFVAGALFYYFYGRVARKNVWGFVLPALPVLLWPETWIAQIVEPIALAAVVVLLAVEAPVLLRKLKVDYSYGLYIVHWPVIQVLLESARFAGRPYWFLAASVGSSLLLAAVLWHLIERKSLVFAHSKVKKQARNEVDLKAARLARASTVPPVSPRPDF